MILIQIQILISDTSNIKKCFFKSSRMQAFSLKKNRENFVCLDASHIHSLIPVVGDVDIAFDIIILMLSE